MKKRECERERVLRGFLSEVIIRYAAVFFKLSCGPSRRCPFKKCLVDQPDKTKIKKMRTGKAQF